MSNQSNQSTSTFSSTTIYTSSISNITNTINGQQSGHQSKREIRSGPDGTIISTSTQKLGEEAVNETHSYDREGREVLGLGGDEGQRKIDDVSSEKDEEEEQAARDRGYEERMEDEYAKREGGA